MSHRTAKKHPLEVRLRAFGIWQELGFFPWKKSSSGKGRRGNGDFYKGAFDGIPFLNDDAKRTFVHLMLRPGYMIRDYIKGQHDKYLAPLTALIIFYAFFALLSSVLQPIQHDDVLPIELSGSLTLNDAHIQIESEQDSTENTKFVTNVAQIVQMGYVYLHLDQYPEEVHTRGQASLAALEGALRSQGIPLFIGDFLILWMAMMAALGRYKLKASACAAASAYVLCQFSFFMLFALLLTFGKSTSISVGLMLVLLVIDFRQWLSISWQNSIRLTFKTGVFYVLMYGVLITLVSLLVLALAYIRQ